MDPVQKELQRYIDIRDHLQEEIQVLEMRKSSMLQELLVFEGEFLQKVDPLQKKLERWIHRCQVVEGILDCFATKEDLPLTTSKWRLEIEGNIQSPDQEPLPTPVPELSKEEKEEAKQLFRQLARRFHPDLVQETELQKERQQMMNQINEAYQKQNLEGLRALLHRPDIVDMDTATAGDQWSQIVREIAHLRTCITQREKEYVELKQSDLVSLMESVERTGDFGHIQAALQQKIELQMARWRQLRVREEDEWLERDG